MTTHAFYLARSVEERRAAAATTLANVRARHLRAAAAWDEMAARAARIARFREEDATRRALRDDAAALIVSAASFADRGH
jgi:hypothetical protein